jgi:hypothetical protein
MRTYDTTNRMPRLKIARSTVGTDVDVATCIFVPSSIWGGEAFRRSTSHVRFAAADVAGRAAVGSVEQGTWTGHTNNRP